MKERDILENLSIDGKIIHSYAQSVTPLTPSLFCYIYILNSSVLPQKTLSVLINNVIFIRFLATDIQFIIIEIR